MGWMKTHKTLLDTAARVVHLDSPIHGIDVLHLSSSSTATPSIHQTVTQNLEDINIAHEFFDVFLEDLPGMPLDRDVEFIIDLQPGMTPISRRPYKMTPKKLPKLKELLDPASIFCLINLPVLKSSPR
jgi:hypothetical protein